ncbi:MAG: AAA family ATPase [Thiofilum sp.]|uniref:AAA family ATPase n=1 Tax=Thiofilum sp. TaxID=2212733 RepID=UPI0025E30DE8|nr:AAA family ATPase [Thiofilum sp.]MBK8454634.1 AAA family ATPase [Thiofilum sp.]
MLLDSLYIQNFRCFDKLQIDSLGQVNLIVGKNSVGKSTLLEAVYLFAKRGRRFAIDNLLKNRNDGFNEKSDLSGLFYNRYCTALEENALVVANKDFTQGFHLTCNSWRLSQFSKEGKILEDTLQLSMFSYEQEHPCELVITDLYNESYLASLWDDISVNLDDKIVKDAMQIITPNIVNIVFVQNPKVERFERIAIVKIKEQARGVSLKSLGEGSSRVLQMFLHALKAQNGFLLIDEFENGLHYSIQEEVWTKLFKVAQELNIQIFATTHSQDTIKSFCKVAIENTEVEGKLLSLGRSAKASNLGQIQAVSFDEEQLKLFVDSGLEVRG